MKNGMVKAIRDGKDRIICGDRIVPKQYQFG
jgi:hypothetical protein